MPKLGFMGDQFSLALALPLTPYDNSLPLFLGLFSQLYSEETRLGQHTIEGPFNSETPRFEATDQNYSFYSMTPSWDYLKPYHKINSRDCKVLTYGVEGQGGK